MRATGTMTATILLAVFILSGLGGCAPAASTPAAREAGPPPAAASLDPGSPGDPGLQAGADLTPPADAAGRLPVRYQRPAYLLQESSLDSALASEDQLRARIPVGADISSPAGPIPLRDILRRLATLKQMNISWSSDINQQVPVDVDIQAEDDFFEAIDNILRQVDYFHEVQRNTIVIKYRETRTFHVAMPFMISTYNTGVGGDVLGAGGITGGGAGTLVGNIQLTSNDNQFDIWENIRQNLDQILDIWEETVQTGTATEEGTGATVTRRNVQAGKGYYAIDKPIGLITVTAPRPLIQRIETYLDNLKGQLFRQISIEAKIIEVDLADNAKTGIDWQGVLSGKHLNFELFGAGGIVYPKQEGRWVTQTTIGPNPFQLLLDAIESQGTTNVLANPKISVLNGQPALITVGETFRYISEVATTSDAGGGVSTSVSTDTVMSGLGLAVLPTITENNEIVLSLTPVTSKLTEPMAERSFQGMTIQLPQINIRELKSVVKVRNGDTLMIGGLIDNVEDRSSNRVPLLAKTPGLGRLFRHDTKTVRKRELVILLQPTIL